ncbi:hypothetical protein R3P38DRAFT_3340801 [Favolaschia claudopus]|uniref:Uncharacterized protein n=1 Tax=Favolaschia claudopus TaxID=2862362 RepID=A0AAW0ECY6_9AGAR
MLPKFLLVVAALFSSTTSLPPPPLAIALAPNTSPGVPPHSQSLKILIRFLDVPRAWGWLQYSKFDFSPSPEQDAFNPTRRRLRDVLSLHFAFPKATGRVSTRRQSAKFDFWPSAEQVASIRRVKCWRGTPMGGSVFRDRVAASSSIFRVPRLSPLQRVKNLQIRDFAFRRARRRVQIPQRRVNFPFDQPSHTLTRLAAFKSVIAQSLLFANPTPFQIPQLSAPKTCKPHYQYNLKFSLINAGAEAKPIYSLYYDTILALHLAKNRDGVRGQFVTDECLDQEITQVSPLVLVPFGIACLPEAQKEEICPTRQRTQSLEGTCQRCYNSRSFPVQSAGLRKEKQSTVFQSWIKQFDSPDAGRDVARWKRRWILQREDTR